MIDDQFVLTVERLRDTLSDLKKDLRLRYQDAKRQVTAPDLRKTASDAAEMWMVTVTTRVGVVDAIGSEVNADLTVRFQRLLTFSEHATLRLRYDKELAAILKDFTSKVVIPLKQRRGVAPAAAIAPPSEHFVATAFVGHSFSNPDAPVVSAVTATLKCLGIDVLTGEKPKSDTVSEKVKRRIEQQNMFVGLFTRRDKIARKSEYSTSTWVIDEKAYALARGKKLILLKEEGVASIGGIQGDYEYIQFDRHELHELVIKLFQLFNVTVAGLVDS
jgi:hypothetical protein